MAHNTAPASLPVVCLGIVLGTLAAACAPTEAYRGPADATPDGMLEEIGVGRGRRAASPVALGSLDLASAQAQMVSDFRQGYAAEAQRLQAPDRQMIYSAAMTLEVARVEDAIARCLANLRELGGYLSGRSNATLTCRVPAAQFEDFLEDLRSFGRVLAESMQARDVTAQHTDLGIRLDNARRSRERLLALLERAEIVEDILKIEQELRRLTEEIERMEAQLKSLDDQVAMSTVSVSFQPVAAPPPVGPRKQSRFAWINMTGAEYVLRWF